MSSIWKFFAVFLLLTFALFILWPQSTILNGLVRGVSCGDVESIVTPKQGFFY